jgi:hypothetical protein
MNRLRPFPAKLGLVRMGLAGTLGPGETAWVQTPGSSSPQVQGWAEVASTGRVAAMAVFKRTLGGQPDSEATVIGTQSGSNVFLPFDNTQGYVTAVALSNTNATQARTLTMTFTMEGGGVFSTSITLPARGHTAFVLPVAYSTTARLRGTMRFSTSAADLAVLGLRFSPNNSFTSMASFQ